MTAVHECFCEGVIVHDDHDFNATQGSCRVGIECVVCGRIGWSKPLPCQFGGNAEACIAALRDELKLLPKSEPDECPDCGAVDCEKNH